LIKKVFSHEGTINEEDSKQRLMDASNVKIKHTCFSVTFLCVDWKSFSIMVIQWILKNINRFYTGIEDVLFSSQTGKYVRYIANK